MPAKSADLPNAPKIAADVVDKIAAAAPLPNNTPEQRAGLAVQPLDEKAKITIDNPIAPPLEGRSTSADVVMPPVAGSSPGLAPGFTRGPDGGLTRNGKPPDAMIPNPNGGPANVVPAWQEGPTKPVTHNDLVGAGLLPQPGAIHGGGGREISPTVPQGTPDQMVTPSQAAAGDASRHDPRGMVPVIQASAAKYGIDPNVAVRVAASEGLGNPVGDNGTSFGAMQLHVHGGMGDDFKRDTGLDPTDLKNEPQMIDYAMKRAAQEGWGAFHGAARVGIGQWAGIGGHPANTGPGPDQLLADPSKSIADQPPVVQAKATAIGNEIMARTPPHERSAMSQWMNSPSYMLFLIGAGMLASRSPFPGVALGEGLLTAAKGMQTQEGMSNKQDIADVRNSAVQDRIAMQSQALAEKSANDVNRLQLQYQQLDQKQQSGQNSLELQQQKAAVAAQLHVAQIQLAQTEHDRKVQADKDKDERERQRIAQQNWHTVIGSNGNYWKQDPTNPGQMTDTGVAAGQHETGQARLAQLLMQPGPNGEPPAANSLPEALALIAHQAGRPTAQQSIELRLQAEAGRRAALDPNYIANPRDVLAKHLAQVRRDFSVGSGAPAAPAAARPAGTPTPAYPPGSSAASGSATIAPALPPRPTTVPDGSAYNPAKRMWRSPQGQIYDAQGVAQ
jgi:hypothetical protein